MLNKTNIDEIRQALKTNRVTVVFEKADGSLRTMLCTLQEKYLPPVVLKEGEEAKPKKDKGDTNIVTVWDLEKTAWRSFYLESLKSFEIETGTQEA